MRLVPVYYFIVGTYHGGVERYWVGRQFGNSGVITYKGWMQPRAYKLRQAQWWVGRYNDLYDEGKVEGGRDWCAIAGR